uniref:probable JmjC domain-containing histone demethylation protein 2C n=1 Tax=Pristiophorus japonicus TaxID=55135 RepID=UPI00398EC311
MMIVMNDKIPDTHSVEPSLIQATVLGDEGPAQSEGCSTYRRPSHRGSPVDSPRQFSSLAMNCQSTFPRRAQDQHNNHSNGKGLACGDSAKHSREGNKYSVEAEMKNHKRKWTHGEGSDTNSPKLPRMCHNSDSRLENGHMRAPVVPEQQDRQEAPLLRHKDHKGMEEIGRVACYGTSQSKTSRRDELFVGNVASSSQENPTKHLNEVALRSSCSSSERRLGQASLTGDDKVSAHKNPTTFQDHLEKSPMAFPIHSIYNNGSWRDTSRLFTGQEGQLMDILKGPLQPSFAGHGPHSSKFESKGSLGVLNHSDRHESPAQKEGSAADALCKVSATSTESQQFGPSSQHHLQLSSAKANNADASRKSLMLNKSDPLPSYNGSGMSEVAWHPFYSSAVPSGMSGPVLASHVTAAPGSGTYSHLNVHFPHFLGAKLPSGNASPCPSLLAINPPLDSAYGNSLGPLASAYGYHPKHLQASCPAPLTAAYGQLNLYPVMWQNVNVDIHPGPRMLDPHQAYMNGETPFTMGLLNPWSFHQSQNNIGDHQPVLGQFPSKSNSKELSASSSSKASSTYFYKEDVNGTEVYGDFLHPFTHGLRKLKVQNTPCSKAEAQPASEVQLYKEVSFQQDLLSRDPVGSQSSKGDSAILLAEARDVKPLSLAFRSEQRAKSGEPPSLSPNPRPISSSKESSTAALDFTMLKHSPNSASNTPHPQVADDEMRRGLTLETTSLCLGVDSPILQHPPFHRPPRETGQTMNDQKVQYKAPLALLQLNSADSRETFRDLSCAPLEKTCDLAKVRALPLPPATPMEVQRPSQRPLIMPPSKSPELTKTLALIPKDLVNKESNGNSKLGRLEPEKTSDLFGISNKAPVYNQMPSASCPPAAEKKLTAVPQMELGEKINKGKCSKTDFIGGIHQESNTDCNPFNKEHLSNSLTPMQSSQGLSQYNYNLSPINGALNTKRINQVINTIDYYTPKKYKAVRTVTPCPKKLPSECPPPAGEMRTNSVKRDINSPKIPMPNASPVKQLSGQDTFSAGQPLPSNPHSCHTKLKKAWLTRHSEQDSTKEQQGRDGHQPPSGQAASKGAEQAGPATLPASSRQRDEGAKRPAAKRGGGGGDGERGDLPESRRWLRTRREGKLADQHKSGQAVVEEEEEAEAEEEKKVKNSSEEKEEEELKGARTPSRKPEKENCLGQNDGSDARWPKDAPRATLLKSAGESFLQDVPCTELFTNVPRCRDCWPSRSRKGPESPPLFSRCRFMQLRRLSITRNGGLKVEGFSTEEQVSEEAPLETWASAAETGLDRDTSTYILTHVGDPFCDLVLAERRLLERVRADYDGAIACKAPIGEKEETCDSCHSVVFNLHWVCPRCGFFVCMDCYDAKQKKSGRNEKERGEEAAAWLKCVKGHNHDIKSLRPTQLVPNTALVGLCDKMHSSRRRLGIKSNCACADGDKNWLHKTPGASKSPKPQTDSKVEATPGGEPSKSRSTTELRHDGKSNHASSCSQSPLHWLAELATRKAKEEANEVEAVPCSRPRNTAPSLIPAHQRSRAVEQCSTLCDLLTTTAGKLRLGCTDAGIAFAPVYTTLNSCNTATRSVPSILDDIIASVVEKKIPLTKSPRQSKENPSSEKSPITQSDPVPNQTQEQRASIQYSWLSKGTFPWICNPTHKNNWKCFQEYWIKGLPVLVSGVLTATSSNSWGPECLRQELGKQSVSLVNCRDHSVLTRARSKEFWEGFKTDSKCPRLKSRGTKILRLDYCASEKEFSERMPAQFDELHKHLPLPEYTRNDGRLNLISRLTEEAAKTQLELRVCSVYGLRLDDGNAGSTSPRLELTDTLHILVHAELAQEDRGTLEKVILARLEGDTVDDAVMRRLSDPSERPGALWHIYSTQDTARIRAFLQKVAEEGDPEGLAGQDQISGQSRYLDQVLRRRLFEECGIQGRPVLQFTGDALLIPMATTYQVQYFTSCITVTKEFVSPEHVKHSFRTRPILGHNTSPAQHKLQMKSILYDTVKDCVETLGLTPSS